MYRYETYEPLFSYCIYFISYFEEREIYESVWTALLKYFFPYCNKVLPDYIKYILQFFLYSLQYRQNNRQFNI